MIIVPAPDGDPYHHPGEKTGRELLAGYLTENRADGLSLLSAGTDCTGGAHAALWLRDLVLATEAVTGNDAMDLRPNLPENLMTMRIAEGWRLAHHFLAGMEPYFLGGVRICCEHCLAELLGAVLSAAGTATLIAFGDAAAAYQHVRAGRPLPVLATPEMMN